MWPSTRWETIMASTDITAHREPWHKGKIVGQKAPFKLKEIWSLRVRLQMEGRVRELALFNLGIDNKLRGCDLVSLKVRDVCHGGQMATRAVVMEQKTQRPVQFEITQAARDALQAWIRQARCEASRGCFSRRRVWPSVRCLRCHCEAGASCIGAANLPRQACGALSSGTSSHRPIRAAQTG